MRDRSDVFKGSACWKHSLIQHNFSSCRLFDWIWFWKSKKSK